MANFWNFGKNKFLYKFSEYDKLIRSKIVAVINRISIISSFTKGKKVPHPYTCVYPYENAMYRCWTKMDTYRTDLIIQPLNENLYFFLYILET